MSTENQEELLAEVAELKIALAKKDEALRLAQAREDEAVGHYYAEGESRTNEESEKLHKLTALFRTEASMRVEEHRTISRKLRDMAGYHQRLADTLAGELRLFDTPELPNLFPSCTSTESPPSPK